MPLEHVLVTGGTGRLGRYVAAELRPRYHVSTLDLPQSHTAPDIPLDILDLHALGRAMRGYDAVVHLAAIDAGVQAPAATVFDTNVRGTWNVFEAARRTGVRRLVLCSSVSALGLDHTNPSMPPLYLPVDEDHPMRPSQPYGLSKQLSEEIARSFARRGSMVIACLRPAWIMFPETLARLVSRLQSTPESDSSPDPLPWMRSYVAPADAAVAIRLALERQDTTFGTYFVTAGDTFEPRPTLEHLRDLYGTLPEVRRPARYWQDPNASPYDTLRAREAFGWTPSCRWHDLVAQLDPRLSGIVMPASHPTTRPASPGAH